MVNLINGDCLEEMKDMECDSIDLTVTSPPYDNLRTYNGNNALWSEAVWKECIKQLYRVTKKGGVVVWVVGDATIKGTETGTSFKQALWAMECGFNLHDTMIWNKPNPIPRSHKRYEQAFEYMFIFAKGKIKTFNPIMKPCIFAGKKRGGTIQHKKDGVRKQKNTGGFVSAEKVHGNVWSISNTAKSSHPAVFPEKIAADHISSWTNAFDIVLDPFMGSGTTGVACKNLSRNFIGIELDKNYFEIAQKRITEGK